MLGYFIKKTFVIVGFTKKQRGNQYFNIFPPIYKCPEYIIMCLYMCH